MNGNKLYREVSKALNHTTKKDILDVRESINMSNIRDPKLWSINNKDDWNNSEFASNKGNNRWRKQLRMLKYYSVRLQGSDFY